MSKSNHETIKVIRVPAKAWAFVAERDRSIVVRIGPFTEGLPLAAAMADKNGDLLISKSFASGERLWAQILRSYKVQTLIPPVWGTGFAEMAKATRLAEESELPGDPTGL